jgi:hypothetical protein
VSDESYSVAVFHNIHAMFSLKKVLDRLGVAVKTIPTPRRLSADCGSALRFSSSQRDAVDRAIEENRLEIQGIHELDG